MISNLLKELLDSANVEYTRHAHPTTYTAQETASVRHIPGKEMAKSVVLNINENKFTMTVLSSNDTVNLDVLKRNLGCDPIRLASESEFLGLFPTCKIGAMPPFGNLFNMDTYCDVALAKDTEIEFNAGAHDETVRMDFEQFNRLANPTITNFAEPLRRHPARRTGP